MTEAEREFEALVGELAGEPGVTPPEEGGRFGSGALKVNGKIFAMLSRGRLVVKLPRDRVQALIGAAEGEPFTAGKGSPMREWVVVTAPPEKWGALAREALRFVSG